jgi:hypothetical protein
VSHRRLLTTAVSALLASLALSPVGGPPAQSAVTRTSVAEPSGVVRDWERNLVDTVYTDNATPIPVGVLYLGFTSGAMLDGVERARKAHGSPSAAVAVAAHDVLTAYFPASTTELDGELAASLAGVPAGWARERGMEAGADAARAMIRSRSHDGRDNPRGIVYDRDPAPGVWQPEPGVTMLAPWLGFVDKLVVDRPIRVDGPDPITSWEYAFDYQEVKRLGSVNSTYRTPEQTDTVQFFNSNSAIMVSEGLLAYLDTHPMDLTGTAHLFAAMHAAMTDAVITCWRLKYQGFWRPYQAIRAGDTDHNPGTVADPTWAPLLPKPPYADYVSGHACMTAPAIEVVRRTLGEDTALTLHSHNTNAERTYATLGEIEFDAFHSRIWGGLHFRDAMEDGYAIGHEAARRALRAMD